MLKRPRQPNHTTAISLTGPLLLMISLRHKTNLKHLLLSLPVRRFPCRRQVRQAPPRNPVDLKNIEQKSLPPQDFQSFTAQSTTETVPPPEPAVPPRAISQLQLKPLCQHDDGAHQAQEARLARSRG